MVGHHTQNSNNDWWQQTCYASWRDFQFNMMKTQSQFNFMLKLRSRLWPVPFDLRNGQMGDTQNAVPVEESSGDKVNKADWKSFDEDVNSEQNAESEDLIMDTTMKNINWKKPLRWTYWKLKSVFLRHNMPFIRRFLLITISFGSEINHKQHQSHQASVRKINFFWRNESCRSHSVRFCQHFHSIKK